MRNVNRLWAILPLQADTDPFLAQLFVWFKTKITGGWFQILESKPSHFPNVTHHMNMKIEILLKTRSEMAEFPDFLPQSMEGILSNALSTGMLEPNEYPGLLDWHSSPFPPWTLITHRVHRKYSRACLFRSATEILDTFGIKVRPVHRFESAWISFIQTPTAGMR